VGGEAYCPLQLLRSYQNIQKSIYLEPALREAGSPQVRPSRALVAGCEGAAFSASCTGGIAVEGGTELWAACGYVKILSP
jgi:hypothetical protein